LKAGHLKIAEVIDEYARRKHQRRRIIQRLAISKGLADSRALAAESRTRREALTFTYPLRLTF
jgi:hypothetical protein